MGEAMQRDVIGQLAQGRTTRREMLWGVGVTGAALAGGSLLAACGGGDSGGDSQSVEFWDEPWGGDAYQPTVKKLIEKFEKEHPEIDVKYRLVPWPNFFEVYNTAIASGATPDVAVAPTFPWEGAPAPPTALL